jgi:D-serine deaminase-like pyridoxal phosphate-dependent protein
VILRYLIRRNQRERWLLGAVGLVLAAVACYVGVIVPARRAVADHKQQLVSTEGNLGLQQRQLTLLRAETTAARKRLEELAGASPPWATPIEADALLQRWQRLAAEVGLTLESVSREHQALLLMDTGRASVSTLTVRLEACGPYANVMAFAGRLKEGPEVIGLEGLDIQVTEKPPFGLRMSLVVRLGISAEEATREGL